MFWKVLRVFRLVLKLVIILLIITLITLLTVYKTPIQEFIKDINYEIGVLNNKMKDENIYRKPYDTVILDKDFNEYFKINNNNYYYNYINEINPLISKFYISIEDEDFYNHTGVDFNAIFRSILSLIENKGDIVQGGSTIHQQVIKNNVIPNGTNIYKRKILEILVAPTFNEYYEKDKVMEFYLNTNYYGNNIYGINNASLYYFNKYTSQLNISEIAMLVGMSNAPSKYNPKANEELAINKRNLVLDKLLKNNTITYDEYEEAVNFEPTYYFNKNSKSIEPYPVSYAIHEATELIMKQEGFEFKYLFNSKSEEDRYKKDYDEMYFDIADSIRNGGYRIYTTLDTNLQNIVQEELLKQLSKTSGLQGSATLIDNRTNTVSAIVGGIGDTEYNRAYQSHRQIGSVAKPIVVYAPAFSTGEYTPDTIMYDEELTKKGEPSNWDNKYIGKTTLRNALAKSINTIPFNILKDIGTKKSLNILSDMEFNGLSYLDNNNLSISIGGFTYGASSEEVAKAYNVFVNQGRYKSNQFIFKITDEFNNEIYKSDGLYKQIYSSDIAYIMLDFLKEPLYANNGTGVNFKIPNHKQFGKTGTTNNNKDDWFVGGTYYYTLAVYSGYDLPKTINKNNSGIVYKNIMSRIHKNLQPQEFQIPDTIRFKNNRPISNIAIQKEYYDNYLNISAEFLDMIPTALNITEYIDLYNSVINTYSELSSSNQSKASGVNKKVLEKYTNTDIEELSKQADIIQLNNKYTELLGLLEMNSVIIKNSEEDKQISYKLQELKEHSEYDYLYSIYNSKLIEMEVPEFEYEENTYVEDRPEFSDGDEQFEYTFDFN